MNNYPFIKEYYQILSKEYPEFLDEYISTLRMQKQKGISVSCGRCYSKMNGIGFWYSSLDHSIAVALIVWNFTHDKKQTLAALFHDIATPSFKHCIDFMNGDSEKQESTEDLTRALITESKEIMALLKRDNISVDEIADYHMYPIADNDTPMLSADRLEYTLINGLGQVKKLWTLDEVKEIYDNIVIVTKEDNTPEMCFKSKELAEKFTDVMSQLSLVYVDDKGRFSMQFLADIMKRMSALGLISINDLYELSEEEIMNKIKECDSQNISECFKKWAEADDVLISDEPVLDKYSVNIKAKKRYIDPLVLIDNKPTRISSVSSKARECINNCLSSTFDRYVYMDFNFEEDKKLNKVL